MDVSELENIKGGSELKYAGCIITNGNVVQRAAVVSAMENVMAPLNQSHPSQTHHSQVR